jgi:hypothetical protein
LRWRLAAFACALRLRRRPSGLRVPPVAPSTTGATERASRTITNAIPPSSAIPSTRAMSSELLVPELVSAVAVVAVVAVVFGVVVTTEGSVAAPAGFAAFAVTFTDFTGFAGFAACVEDGTAPPNGFCASLAPAAAGVSRNSDSAAHAHAAGRSLIGRAGLIGVNGRIELDSQRRA